MEGYTTGGYRSDLEKAQEVSAEHRRMANIGIRGCAVKAASPIILSNQATDREPGKDLSRALDILSNTLDEATKAAYHLRNRLGLQLRGGESIPSAETAVGVPTPGFIAELCSTETTSRVADDIRRLNELIDVLRDIHGRIEL